MPKYLYIALNDKQKNVTGSIEAADRSAVSALLTKQGFRPISIKEGGSKKDKKGSFGSFMKSNKVKSDDLVIFTRQLSAMIGAGVPLLRGLTSLQEHGESEGLNNILSKVIKDVEGGANFADALEKFPDVFSDIYINMVRAGETAGILDDILKRLALQQEKNATIRKKVKSAMTYPMVLIAITILAFFGLMLFVIPQIGNMLTELGGPDAELPMITQIMLTISGFMTSYWYIVFPIIAAGIFMALKYIKTPTGKYLFHRLVLKAPGVKSIIKKVAVARFARTFSALIGAGVPVLESLRVSARAIGNTVYEKALTEAGEAVKNGRQLSEVIDENPLFPAILAQMMSVGEETGQTDVVLVKVADFYEEEVDLAIDGISSIIEPAMIVIMGGMVGLIAASVMSPIASLSQNIQG